jgi:hypothetical protein
MQRVALTLLVAVAGSSAALGQAASPAARDSATTRGLRTNHAVGYYDPVLRRVVLIGSAAQPRAADRDQVWSWSGSRWDVVTDQGPPARSNAGAAYDVRRRRGVVAGGARSVNDSTYEIIAASWEGDSSGWRPIGGTDIDPRDHQAMVFDETRGVVLMFGGIPAIRSSP